MSYIVQGSGEWLAQRRGKLTASRVADAIAKLKGGGWAKSRADLMKELVAERMTDASIDRFVSPEMRWGIDQEPNAKAEYEEATGLILVPATFVDHPSIENFGATCDAYQGRDTVVEFKCPKTTTHLQYVLNGTVPDDYKPQILAQLACVRRQRAVFVSYDPRVNGPQRLFIREWEPDAAEIAAIESMAREFLEELEVLFSRVTEAA